MGYLLTLSLFLAFQKTTIVVSSYHVTEFPSKSSEAVEQVIVTSERLRPAFESFAEWKREKGVNCVIRTVNWIDRNYPGCDSPQRIRNFVRDARYKWETRYVLLGGDVDEVPMRYVRSKNYYPGYYEIGTDMYYANLEGSWNANGNDAWGEVAVVQGTDTLVYSDGTTYDTHLWVGRFPVRTLKEAETVINKTVNYERGSLGSMKYTNKLLMAAAKLRGTTADETVWHCNQIANCFPDYFTKHMLHDSLSSAPATLTRRTFLDSLTKGYSYGYAVIHGSPSQDWQAPCNVNRVDADTLHSPWFFMTVVSCYCNWAGASSLAQHFMLNPEGWTFGYRGSSRVGWDAQELELNVAFYSKLFADTLGDSTTEIGKLSGYAKSRLTPFIIGGGREQESNYRDTYLAYYLLGDPELRLWTDIPESLFVSLPEVIDVGEGELKVTIRNSSSQPVRHARVCVSRKNELYAKGLTNGNGEITFTLCPETAGMLQVVVTKQGFTPWKEYLFVNPTKPFVKYKSHFVNERIETGSEFALLLSLENTGAVRASNVEAELKPDSSLVTMIDSVQDYGDLNPSVSGTRDYRIKVNKEYSSQQLSFVIISRFDEGSSEDTFCLEIFGPGLSHYSHSMSKDSICPGIPIDLSFKIKNSGNGEATNVKARLLSLNPQVSVVDSIEDMNFIPGHKIISYPNCFSILPNDTVTNPEFVLELEDSLSRKWVDTFSLRFPEPPESLYTLSGHHFVTIGWKPEYEMYGYSVYKAPDTILLSFDATWETPLFTDNEPDEYKLYHYWVTAIDSNLNESRFSSRVSGAPNPFMKEGWPRAARDTRAYFITAAGVGNIDPATPELEVVVNGDDGIVYAWHHDGEGLLSTDGMFADNLGSCWTAPTIADIDGDGKAEIIRAQGFAGSEKLYVFTEDGSQLPGFPVGLEGDWGTFSTPAVQDLDGDGLLEIIALGHSSGNVYVFRSDGSGFLNENGIFAVMDNSVASFGAPAVADIDGDDTLEIITACLNGLYAWDIDGTLIPGWPVTILGNPSLPAIGDIDPLSPGLEIAIHSTGHALYVFHTDGSLFWRRTCPTVGASRMSSPTLGDVDGDSLLEIALIGRDKLHLWNHDSTFVRNGAGVPVEKLFIPMMSSISRASPVIGDVDGDGESEIIVVSLPQGDLYAFEGDGTVTPGFPITANGLTDGTPTIVDIDFDGANELIVPTATPDVRMWGVLGTKLEWGTFGHDSWRTGCYGFVPPVVSITEGRQVIAESFRLFQNAPNPFVVSTAIRYAVTSKGRVSLSVYDVSGRLVRILVDKEMHKGCHEVKWQGKDSKGKNVAKGVYFYRLRAGGVELTKKLIVM